MVWLALLLLSLAPAPALFDQEIRGRFGDSRSNHYWKLLALQTRRRMRSIKDKTHSLSVEGKCLLAVAGIGLLLRPTFLGRQAAFGFLFQRTGEFR